MFDITKAKRNAERYLSQGKIRSAIEEFKQIVRHDPKDFSTLNMLGDLYIKNSDARSAVKCFYPVAEHYGKQGFAAKAIAVYNKISRVEPNSIKVSERLAELYKLKGSVIEARSHYSTLAEHYRKTGKSTEALAIWEQIALLDTENTSVCLTMAEEYQREGRKSEAARILSEAGNRFSKQKRFDEALQSFRRALDILPNHLETLKGFAEAKFSAGNADEAIAELEQLLEGTPHNRELICLIAELQIRMKNTAEAEKLYIRLVEIDPASYPKLVELAGVCYAENDPDASVRLLTIASERMLAGGEIAEFSETLEKVLADLPEHLGALKLMVRLSTWRRDEDGFRDSLQTLAEAARKAENTEDERFALSQLVMVLPPETEYAGRLRELNAFYGFDDDEVTESLFDKKFLDKANDVAQTANGEAGELNAAEIHELIEAGAEIEILAPTENGDTREAVLPAGIEGRLPSTPEETEEQRLNKECESIRFYIESGYGELAEKAIEELTVDFGERPEIQMLREYLVSQSAAEIIADEWEGGNQPAQPNGNSHSGNGNTFDDFRNELGLDECEAGSSDDFETHFNTAIAYKEMGLLEQAIHEFQEAASIVKPNDGSRCFFGCANLLGHCFLEIGKPNLSVVWYERALETHELSDEERMALWYELGLAHEAGGEADTAADFFEKVYAENINYRDVGERVRAVSMAG